MTENNFDFSSFKTKTIDLKSCYYPLLAQQWKYLIEDNDLFAGLTKTIWKESIKVIMSFEGFCNTPPAPNKSMALIDSIDFYSFNPVLFKQKTIYAEYEDLCREGDCQNFETAKDYIDWMNKNSPHYIPFADFNTEDFDLLTHIDVKEVPVEIQKQVWEDLLNVQII